MINDSVLWFLAGAMFVIDGLIFKRVVLDNQ